MCVVDVVGTKFVEQSSFTNCQNYRHYHCCIASTIEGYSSNTTMSYMSTYNTRHGTASRSWRISIAEKMRSVCTFIYLFQIDCINFYSNQTAQVQRCPVDPYHIVPDKCRCVDYQVLKLQENPENVPHGEMPRHVQLYADRLVIIFDFFNKL